MGDIDGADATPTEAMEEAVKALDKQAKELLEKKK